MKTTHSKPFQSIAAVVILALYLLPGVPYASAVVAITDATWISDGDPFWNNSENWDTGSFPNSPSAKATFLTSPVTTLSLGQNISVAQITFGPGASAFTIQTAGSNLDFWGAGIINNSGQTQTIYNGGVAPVPDPIVTFHGSSSADNAVIINVDPGNSVQFFDTSTAGKATIINQGSGTFAYFEGLGEGLGFSGPSAGNATIINQGPGSFVEFSNVASGGNAMIINASPTSYVDISQLSTSGTTLGGIAGVGTIFLGSKNLTVGGNNLSTVFAGVISDGKPLGEEPGEEEGPPKEGQPLTGGSLTKVGTGVLNLTGANTYTGNTIINGGTLLINGSTVSPFTIVNAGGTLGGSGVIGGTVINNGGTLSPGNSPGTLTIKGNYTQGSAGTLVIQIASPTVFDHLIVGGGASLGGTLVIDPLNGFKLKRGEEFAFLTAGGGITGQFQHLVQPDSGTLLKFRLVYEGNEVLLETVVGSFVLKGLTPNQTAISKELNRLVSEGRDTKLIDYLSGKPLNQLPGDYDLIAAEELTSIFTLGTAFDNVQSLNIQRRNDDLRSGASGFSAAGFHTAGSGPSYSGGFNITTGVAGPNGDEGKEVKEVKNVVPPENRWGAFITGVGQWVGVSDDFNARGYDIETGGFTLGVDYKVCPNFAVGLMAGYVGTGMDLTDGGRVFVNGGKLGIYATTFVGGWYADTAVTGGYSSYDTRRAALQGTARGDTDGGDLNVLFGTGYDWKVGGLTFGPTGTFNYTYVGIRDFTEDGSLAPLHFGSQGQESLRTAFGLKASYDCHLGGIVVKPEIRAAWQREYGDTANSLDSSFASGAGNVFNVNGPRLGRDSLLVGAGFAIQCSERCSTYFYYDGELARKNYNSQSVSGGFRFTF